MKNHLKKLCVTAAALLTILGLGSYTYATTGPISQSNPVKITGGYNQSVTTQVYEKTGTTTNQVQTGTTQKTVITGYRSVQVQTGTTQSCQWVWVYPPGWAYGSDGSRTWTTGDGYNQCTTVPVYTTQQQPIYSSQTVPVYTTETVDVYGYVPVITQQWVPLAIN